MPPKSLVLCPQKLAVGSSSESVITMIINLRNPLHHCVGPVGCLMSCLFHTFIYASAVCQWFTSVVVYPNDHLLQLKGSFFGLGSQLVLEEVTFTLKVQVCLLLGCFWTLFQSWKLRYVVPFLSLVWYALLPKERCGHSDSCSDYIQVTSLYCTLHGTAFLKKIWALQIVQNAVVKGSIQGSYAGGEWSALAAHQSASLYL